MKFQSSLQVYQKSLARVEAEKGSVKDEVIVALWEALRDASATNREQALTISMLEMQKGATLATASLVAASPLAAIMQKAADTINANKILQGE